MWVFDDGEENSDDDKTVSDGNWLGFPNQSGELRASKRRKIWVGSRLCCKADRLLHFHQVWGGINICHLHGTTCFAIGASSFFVLFIHQEILHIDRVREDESVRFSEGWPVVEFRNRRRTVRVERVEEEILVRQNRGTFLLWYVNVIKSIRAGMPLYDFKRGPWFRECIRRELGTAARHYFHWRPSLKCENSRDLYLADYCPSSKTNFGEPFFPKLDWHYNFQATSWLNVLVVEWYQT